jgi:succinate dehydrogenase / fumarate reductase, cytochrome b subunit
MSAVVSDSTTPSRAGFFLRRLHSLSGVVPLGAFLVEHLWTNAAALAGPARFDRAVAEIQAIPALPLVEIFGIVLPLVFHAVYGVVIATRGSANPGAYPFTRNWMYVLQRVSGVVVFVFVMGHLWEYRVQKWLFGMDASAFHPTLEAHLSWTWFGVPWIAIGYLVGIAAAVFHLANGLATFCMSWGITVGRAAQRRAAFLFGSLGLVLYLLATATVLHLATGTRFVPGLEPREETPPCGP